MTSLRTLMRNQGFYRIPLKKLRTGHYKLSAKINNTIGDFILDTGASTSCIGLESISLFSLLNEDSEIKAAGAGATDMNTQLARNNQLQIGSQLLKNADFILFDLYHVNEALSQSDEEKVHGIIGADFLKKYRAVIDYGRNCFYIKP